MEVYTLNVSVVGKRDLAAQLEAGLDNAGHKASTPKHSVLNKGENRSWFIWKRLQGKSSFHSGLSNGRRGDLRPQVNVSQKQRRLAVDPTRNQHDDQVQACERGRVLRSVLVEKTIVDFYGILRWGTFQRDCELPGTTRRIRNSLFHQMCRGGLELHSPAKKRPPRHQSKLTNIPGGQYIVDHRRNG
ncbi:uncharacterized protein LOC118761063 [Octopus sinensis]|uniref:Uncharacterized protein LOC118761063 n=1 Tax=Octopus sinensis TaxID=2607531 RepID=A0A7E6EGC5_9MOLL|nr:uncharacterized protein LOC118761063 [Octopus sinensis]